MDLNPQQIIFQLGIAGLIVWVGYRIAMVLIRHWREAEKERTAAISEGFKAVTTSVDMHSTADVASHEKLATSHGELREAVVRVEGKIDAALDWQERTPVGVPVRIPKERPSSPYMKRPPPKDGDR